MLMWNSVCEAQVQLCVKTCWCGIVCANMLVCSSVCELRHAPWRLLEAKVRIAPGPWVPHRAMLPGACA